VGFFLPFGIELNIMNKKTQTYQYNGALQLESGRSINNFPLVYTTIGELNESKDNVIWIFHAMTANSDPSDWWSGMVGEGKFFDPQLPDSIWMAYSTKNQMASMNSSQDDGGIGPAMDFEDLVEAIEKKIAQKV